MSGEVKYKPAFFLKHCALPLFSRFADSPEKVYHFLRDLNFTLERLRIKWNDFSDLDLPQLLKDPQLTLDKLNDLLSFYRYPEMQGDFGFQKIEFRDGGNCPNSVYLPAKFTLAETPTPRRLPLPETTRRPRYILPRLPLAQALRNCGAESTEAELTLGRTMVFKGPDGKKLAAKFQRPEESLEDLEREAFWSNYLGKHQTAIGLKSDYPVFQEMIKTGPGAHALIYQAPESYFTYLNAVELSCAEFKMASFKALHDLFTLARHHILHISLARFSHNNMQLGRNDRGRFLWMANIFNPMGSRTGTGRLTAWTEALNYPNLRASGLADLAELRPLKQLLERNNPESSHLVNAQYSLRHSANFYLAHYLGDYLFTWTLLSGQHFKDRSRLDRQDCLSQKYLAELIREGFSIAYRAYTGLSYEDPGIGWERLALQMAYFMSGNYASDLLIGTIPPEVYGKEVAVEIAKDLPDSRGWTEAGWMVDGKNPDLGPFNGPFPIQELISALYISTAQMIRDRAAI